MNFLFTDGGSGKFETFFTFNEHSCGKVIADNWQLSLYGQCVPACRALFNSYTMAMKDLPDICPSPRAVGLRVRTHM